MEQRAEIGGERAFPVLPPEYGYEIEPDGLTVFVGGDEGERTDVLRFGEGWTPEAVENAVYEYDGELLDFGERFFALWREVFGENRPPSEV